MAGKVVWRDSVQFDPNALSVRVGEWLQERGYHLADEMGCYFPSPYASSHVNILGKDFEFGGRGFWFLKTKPRRRWIGSIWFDNEARKATSARWHFDVHTQGSRTAAEAIAKELAWVFKVDIVLGVTNDYVFGPRERFRGDYIPH